MSSEQESSMFDCKRCKEENVEYLLVVSESETSPHYGKYVCAKMNHFIRWAKSPLTIARHEERQEQIDFLLGDGRGNLSDFAKEFLEDIKGRTHLSPKQQSYYDAIRDKNSVN